MRLSTPIVVASIGISFTDAMSRHVPRRPAYYGSTGPSYGSTFGSWNKPSYGSSSYAPYKSPTNTYDIYLYDDERCMGAFGYMCEGYTSSTCCYEPRGTLITSATYRVSGTRGLDQNMEIQAYDRVFGSQCGRKIAKDLECVDGRVAMFSGIQVNLANDDDTATLRPYRLGARDKEDSTIVPRKDEEKGGTGAYFYLEGKQIWTLDPNSEKGQEYEKFTKKTPVNTRKEFMQKYGTMKERAYAL